MYQKEQAAILHCIKQYGDGIYKGDVDLLKSVFSSDVILYGDIKGVHYEKTLSEYLEAVTQRKSPKELKENFNPKVLSVDILGKAAFVKVHVPMLGYNYYDFLSLFKTAHGWKIVNKLFVDVA